jgi:DNA-3-methyladenine glycosylase
MAVLPRSFYARDPETVARALLGQWLCYGNERRRINEVEAYPGTGDAAAHSARGITPRTKVIFGPPGFAYIYFIYGMHHCLNVVTEPEGTPGCVLIRGVDGIAGPGRLTRALGLSMAQNGLDLTQSELRVEAGGKVTSVLVTPRIGLRVAAELPLRFVARGSGIS